MSRGRPLVADAPEQAPKRPEKPVADCAAHGCPLPGTIRPENGEPVCGIHLLADKSGWPKTTAVILDHQKLHEMAKRAQHVGTPHSMNAESAALLMESAKAHGLVFGDTERETYRRAGMKLNVAGALVEAAISVAAVGAAVVRREMGDQYEHEKKTESFNATLRGLTNNLRLAA